MVTISLTLVPSHIFSGLDLESSTCEAAFHHTIWPGVEPKNSHGQWFEHPYSVLLPYAPDSQTQTETPLRHPRQEVKGARCLMKYHDHQTIRMLFSAFPANIVNWRIYSYRNSIQSLLSLGWEENLVSHLFPPEAPFLLWLAALIHQLGNCSYQWSIDLKCEALGLRV